MISRRTVLFCIGAVLSAPAGAVADTGVRPRRRVITVLPGAAACGSTGAASDAFAKALADYGHSDVLLQRMCFENSRELDEILTRVTSEKPIVMVTWGTMAGRAAKAVAHSIPVVFGDVSDPEKFGLIKTMARPGSNMTGLTSMKEDLTAKRMEVLREAVPDVTRVALLGNPSNAAYPNYVREAKQAAGALSISARFFEADGSGEFIAFCRDSASRI